MTPAHLKALEAIYAAALNPDLWQAAMDAITAVRGAIGTQLLHADEAQKQLNRSVAAGYDPAAGESWDRYYSRINVWAPGILTMPVGVPWHGERICSFDKLRRTEFYNDWVRPNGDIAGGGAIVLERSPGRLTVLGGNLPQSHRDRLDDAWQFDLALYGPAIRFALEVNRVLLGLRLEQVLARQGTTGETAAVLLLDRKGQVMFADKGGALMIEAGRTLAIKPNLRLGFHDMALDEAFAHILKDRSAVAPLVRRISGSGETVTLLPLTEGATASLQLPPHPPERAPRIAVMIARPSMTTDPPIGARLGLTEAEAEIAMSLTRGFTPAEIAEARGASPNTVRNQIKSILAKTGCRRQSEVVALVLRIHMS